jgi:hypothetical protein
MHLAQADSTGRSRDMPLSVGVTGHRDQALNGADRGLLEDHIQRVLIAAAGDQTEPGPVLISPLAEGADCLAARAALSLGWRLECPLPFPPEEYERDFTSARSLKEFRELLALAGKVWLAGGNPADMSERAQGYAAANRDLLRASNLILAVWDGKEARGEGGTGQVVSQALDRGLMVLCLDSAPPHALSVMSPGGSAPPPALAALGDLLAPAE